MVCYCNDDDDRCPIKWLYRKVVCYVRSVVFEGHKGHTTLMCNLIARTSVANKSRCAELIFVKTKLTSFNCNSSRRKSSVTITKKIVSLMACRTPAIAHVSIVYKKWVGEIQTLCILLFINHGYIPCKMSIQIYHFENVEIRNYKDQFSQVKITHSFVH